MTAVRSMLCAFVSNTQLVDWMIVQAFLLTELNPFIEDFMIYQLAKHLSLKSIMSKV